MEFNFSRQTFTKSSGCAPTLELTETRRRSMKKVSLILLVPVFTLSAARINFGSDAPGTVPQGWSVFMTHQGGAPKWEVVADRTAPGKKGYAVGQTSKDQ